MGNKIELKNFIDSLKENINFSFDVYDFNDRLKLQKYVFLAKYFGFKHNYIYSLYIRGPYSSSLADDYYDIYRNEIESNDCLDMDFDNFAKLTLNKDVDWLEAASTMLSLYKGFEYKYSKYSDKNKKKVLIKGTKKLKSHIDDEIIYESFQDLNNYHLFNWFHMPIHNYVDTDHLYSFFIYKDSKIRRELISKKHIDEEKLRHDIFQKLLSGKNNEIFIKVPLIAIGELFNNLNRKCTELDSNLLNSIYEDIFITFRKDNIDIKPPSKECYKLSYRLMEKDSRFTPTDALIVSQALSDNYSSFLYSFDNVITQTYVDGIISELNKELCDNGIRNHELKIKSF